MPVGRAELLKASVLAFFVLLSLSLVSSGSGSRGSDPYPGWWVPGRPGRSPSPPPDAADLEATTKCPARREWDAVAECATPQPPVRGVGGKPHPAGPHHAYPRTVKTVDCSRLRNGSLCDALRDEAVPFIV